MAGCKISAKMRCKTTALRIYWQGSLLPRNPKAETVIIIGHLQDLDRSRPFLTECSRCCFAHPPIFSSCGLFQHLLYLSSLFLLATFPKSFSFNNIFVFFFSEQTPLRSRGDRRLRTSEMRKLGSRADPCFGWGFSQELTEESTQDQTPAEYKCWGFA